MAVVQSTGPILYPAFSFTRIFLFDRANLVISLSLLLPWEHVFCTFTLRFWLFLLNRMLYFRYLCLFFKKILEDMSPFCGATDTPVSDFWWRLLWVSKPEWVLPYSSLAEAYMLHYTFPEIHLRCDTCQPLGGQHGSWAISSTYMQGIGGTRNWELSCCHSVWDQADAIPTELSRLGLDIFVLQVVKWTV